MVDHSKDHARDSQCIGQFAVGPTFAIADVEKLLHDCARAYAVLTYGEALAAFGHAFSRPLMRALCMLLDEADRRAVQNGQPELAVLIVRASDGLPGQGWWIGRPYHAGAWTGPEARDLVAGLQNTAHVYWNAQPHSLRSASIGDSRDARTAG